MGGGALSFKKRKFVLPQDTPIKKKNLKVYKISRTSRTYILPPRRIVINSLSNEKIEVSMHPACHDKRTYIHHNGMFEVSHFAGRRDSTGWGWVFRKFVVLLRKNSVTDPVGGYPRGKYTLLPASRRFTGHTYAKCSHANRTVMTIVFAVLRYTSWYTCLLSAVIICVL